MKPLLSKTLARRSSPGHFGLTLVEVLIAVTILSLALLAYLNAAVASRAALDKGNFYTIAAQIAGDKITECQNLGYANLVDGTTTYTISGQGMRQGRMTVVIGPLDGNALNTRIKQVDVTVSWAAASSQTPQTAGRAKQSTLICQRK